MKKATIYTIEQIKNFWERQAEEIPWFSHWDEVLQWEPPTARWFVGGTLNASYACVDVHVQGDRKHKVAIHWEDEQGNERTLTYAQLHEQVISFAAVLKRMGVTKGDVVVLYLPMIPEAVIAMLAVARLGAVHSVVFSGFSSQALQDRINDAAARFVITADIGMRRGKKLPLKQVVDEAVINTPSIKNILVIQRGNTSPIMQPGRDIFFHELLGHIAGEMIDPIAMQSTDPLFMLYTSGTTGKPKGLIHATGGYLTYVYSSFKWVFDPHEDSVYWCNADIGWITGHSYVVYGPLMHGLTMVLFEGAPDFPNPGIWWRLIEKYRVSLFYTSPTALRMCRKFGDAWPRMHDLSSLKLLGTVGEVINPDVWEWYHRTIGGGRCPIVDTWWQTETGGIMIAPTPGLDLIKLKPGSATLPLPCIEADVVDEHGASVANEVKGYLVIKQPWPGMTAGIHADQERFKQVYWSKFPGMYYTGDYALRDQDGYFWLLGRADEVLNVAGHRVGTAEIESAAIMHQHVSEAAAIGVCDTIKGQGVVLFVMLRQGLTGNDLIHNEIITKVKTQIGNFITPRDVFFVEKLPKTRSGKIMRRLLKAVVDGEPIGDTSTLEDATSIEEAKQLYQAMTLAIKQRNL